MLMSKKLSINNFEWIKDISQSDKDFIKNYNKENDKGYFSKLRFDVLKNYMNLWSIIFTWKNEDWKCRKTYY